MIEIDRTMTVEEHDDRQREELGEKADAVTFNGT